MSKHCQNCIYYDSSNFCGYTERYCRIYGSLDVNQQERHPDVIANTCESYIETDKSASTKNIPLLITSEERKNIIKSKRKNIENKLHEIRIDKNERNF